MLRTRLLAIVAVLISTTATAREELPALVKRVSPSVVTVVVRDSSGDPLSQGSGFFLTETLVVTNHHVVEGASAAIVRLKSGVELKVEGLVADDRQHDLALLQVATGSTHVAPLKLQTVLPEIGEKLITIGSPAGYEQSVSEGIVSGIRQEKPYGTVLQTTVAASGGSSGGPVMNLKGEVVGVVCYRDVRGTLLQFAIPSASIDGLKHGDLRPLELVLPPLDSSPPDVPSAFMDGLSEAHRKAVTAACQWYACLPDGLCVNLYRTYRAWQVAAAPHANWRRWAMVQSVHESHRTITALNTRTCRAGVNHRTSGCCSPHFPVIGGSVS